MKAQNFKYFCIDSVLTIKPYSQNVTSKKCPVPEDSLFRGVGPEKPDSENLL
jgi:hypothetical protein